MKAEQLGWDASFEVNFDRWREKGLIPGRVVRRNVGILLPFELPESLDQDVLGAHQVTDLFVYGPLVRQPLLRIPAARDVAEQCLQNNGCLLQLIDDDRNVLHGPGGQ